MSLDPNIFECLLNPSEIFAFYKKIGSVLKNDRDIANERIHGNALHNTLMLLEHTSMIQQREGEYIKLLSCHTRDSFYSTLISEIKNTYADEVSTIINCDKHYDEAKNQFFIYVNDIPLRYMGLAMLMEQTGEFERIRNREYFVGINNYRDTFKQKPLLSIEELQKKLQLDIKSGEQAEKFALEYEMIRLKQAGINKEPVRISSIDVMAGYDMVSYESESSTSYDRFVEVKAISKNGFYWSKNEYETAMLKADKYYLYLVDLKNIDKPGYAPDIIQNPAMTVMKSEGWFAEAESYHIKRI
ncbi:DUF3883 domain-containing protein [bacterium]|nr:DUF3883 domain-containing protein [bacterium]